MSNEKYVQNHRDHYNNLSKESSNDLKNLYGDLVDDHFSFSKSSFTEELKNLLKENFKKKISTLMDSVKYEEYYSNILKNSVSLPEQNKEA